MIAFGPGRRYFLYRDPTDMRKGFDSLSGLVRNSLARDPLSGDVFVFVNRRRTHIKLLVWDRTGFALHYKRLERGTFQLPDVEKTGILTWGQLLLMLEGIELRTVRYRRRFTLDTKSRKTA